MAAWSRKTLKFCEKFCVFWQTTPCGKIVKILFRKFSSPHRSTLLCSNFVKFGRREISQIVRYLLDRKKTNIISHAPQNVATAQIAPKICQGQPQQCTPDFIPIGSHSAELCQNAWTPPKVNPILGGSNTFQPNKDVGLVDSTQRHTRYIRPAYIKHGGRDGKFMTTVYILRMQPRYSDSIAHRACINSRQHGHPLSVRGPFRTTSYRAVRYH